MTSKETAKKTYERAVVIDGLNVSNWESPAVYKSLHKGKVTAINATIVVWEDYAKTMDHIAEWLVRFREYGDVITQARSAKDILKAKRDGKTGVILGWQNATPIDDRLDRLALFYELGVRIIQVTYNERNRLGNGCYERRDEGLSHFGVDAVREMNRLGILVDLSHVGDRTTLDAAEISEMPVACTHANARAFVNHVRNKPGDALKVIAEKGGVIGANAWPTFLRKGYESTVADYVDAIDDLVERIGVDHVGIGTDYCQDQPHRFFEWIFAQQGTKFRPLPMDIPDPHYHPEGMETPDTLGNVAIELGKRGYKPEDIEKVLGGNWMRLFRQVFRG
ncbi:MAG: membrane dipeptidase [SAR202 cluster bacterium]|nr:membrane dipeptidase [SAR202 cluster bacterium]